MGVRELKEKGCSNPFTSIKPQLLSGMLALPSSFLSIFYFLLMALRENAPFSRKPSLYPLAKAKGTLLCPSAAHFLCLVPCTVIFLPWLLPTLLNKAGTVSRLLPVSSL